MENEKTLCPVSTIINLIGGKYKSLILWNLIGGVMRFGELQRIVSDATPRMLTLQLRELEGDGLIKRTVYPVVPPKVEYELTREGREMIPILEVMYECGERILKKQGKCPNCSMKKQEP